MRLTTALLLAVAAASAYGTDIAATLPIDKVTAYRGSAIVTRAGIVEIPAGEHRLIVRGLPDGVDPATLRLSARSGGLRLGAIETERIIEGELVGATERTLTRKLRDLADQKAAIEDDIVSAQAQIKLLEAVTADPTGSGINAQPVAPAAIPTLVSAVGSGDAAARARVRGARLQIRDLEEQIAATKAELGKVATNRRATTELRASIIAIGGGAVPVSLDYQMLGVGWSWQYEARLDSQKKKVALVRQAQLSQGTGEDWKNIELTISTSRPGLNATTPPVASAFLSFVPEQTYGNTGERLEEVVVTGLRGSSRRSAAQTTVVAAISAEDIGALPDNTMAAPLQRVSARVYASDFVADYRIPGRVNVTADRQPRVYPIGDDELDVELVARANLSADRAAYLEAKLNYKSDLPIDAGEVQLYRDDAFVGLGELPLVLPGADVRIPFGQDDRIRIVVRDEREESGNTGVISKDKLEQHKRRFEITSYHALPFPIEIIDRVPVARANDIRVEVLKGATAPTTRDLDGHAGVYLWRLAGEPRKTETIRHYYSVRFPRARQLQQSASN
jgi:uncharacterized protein (TIGR02231 family)